MLNAPEKSLDNNSIYTYNAPNTDERRIFVLAKVSKQKDVVEVYEKRDDIIEWMMDELNSYDIITFDNIQTSRFLRNLMRGSEGNSTSKEFGIEFEKANSCVKRFWSRFEQMNEYRETIYSFGQATGRTRTYLGNVFKIDEFRIDVEKGKRHAFNVAIATSVNELLLQGLVNTIPKLKNNESLKMLSREYQIKI